MKLVMNVFLPCVLLLAMQQDVVAYFEGKQLRHEKQMIQQPPTLLPPADMTTKNKHDQKVMDAISQFRAEMCANMKDEHGKDFASYDSCKKYMEEACHPGKDETMDGDSKEVTSEKGFCTEYFPKAEKKAEAKVTAEEKEFPVASAPAPSPGNGPAPVPAPAPAPKTKAPAPAPAAVGPAPAPALSPGPAPGPVPAPFIPGVSAGKPHGPLGDDEAYYYKKEGKDAGRLHMSEKLKLPTQGYWGKLVEHEDGVSQTDDWGKEFGPSSGHDSFRTICEHHPENPWCEQQGYNRHKNSCKAALVSLLPMVIAFLAIQA